MSNEENSTLDSENSKDSSTEEERTKDLIEESSVPLSQYEKIKDDYLRLAADFDNYKKRTDKEKENLATSSIAYLISGLFPLIDNFEMAMVQNNISEETKTLYTLLEKTLENLQVKSIGIVGESFDPSIHEAVENIGDGELQTVDTVLRKGYKFQSQLIRPAMVKVKSE